MARLRTVESFPCPKHPGSHVVAVGVRTVSTGRRQDFRCTPLSGKPHKYSLPVAEDSTPVVARWSAPPKCPLHPDSKVVRNGRYGTKTTRPRQRYRCTPADGERRHSFTPSLPRDHVHSGESHCEHCEELRGIHRGETSIARRHTWSTRIVIRGLELLATGQSYAEVGRWAQRVTGYERTRKKPTPPELEHPGDIPPPDLPEKDAAPKSTSAQSARNAWHIAADWVEAFSPTIYEHIDAELRSDALRERARLDDALAADEPLTQPQVVLVDDVPVYGRDLERGTARRDTGFYVLAAAETHWDGPDPTGRLRLVRAYPKSNTAAWLLVFDELGYDPDFIVADAGTGIVAAIDSFFGPRHTKLIPSMWHLNDRISRALNDTKGAHTVTRRGRELIAPLREHCYLLRRGSDVFDDANSWSAWWDELERLLRKHHLGVDKARTQRRNNEARMAAVLDDLRIHPKLPLSTGGLETLIAKHVQPLLARRRTAFANIERTNSLFDLVVANHHGAFDHPGELARLLREDANAHDGWTIPLRSISDPRPRRGTYSSLRDTTLLTDLASQRGLL